jgi:hypothetical protein
MARSMVIALLTPNTGGLPGNGDQAAMSTFRAFHLLGLCTSSARLHMFLLPMMVIDLVPSTTQFLVSPFLPIYVIHTSLSITTSFTFLNCSPKSVHTSIYASAVAYVRSVTINGKPNLEGSGCFFDFYDVFKTGGEVVIELTADRASMIETEDGSRQGERLVRICLIFVYQQTSGGETDFFFHGVQQYETWEPRDWSIDGEALRKTR